MPGRRDHDADHNAISRTLDEWDFDPDARVDILRDTLILHLGAFHGWTVAKRGGILGLTLMLVEHDRAHHFTDVLAVESVLDRVIVEGIRQDGEGASLMRWC